MAKFQINRKSLIHEANQDFALTRVPNSNMEYYVLVGKEDVIASDDKTVVVEWNDNRQLDIIPAIREEGKDWRAPSLQEAIEERMHPSDNIVHMTAKQLEDNYYRYEDIFDPQEKARIEAERRQLREQAKNKSVSQSTSDQRTIKQDFAGDKNVNTENQTSNRQEFTYHNPGERQQKSRQQEFAYHKPKAQQQSQAENQKEQVAQQQPQASNQQAQNSQQHYYNKQQFHEIKMGVRRGLEVGLYSNIHFNAEQMRELRLALQQGVDIKVYNNPLISAEHMKELRLGAENGVALDLSKLDQTLYNAEQIHELRLGFEKGLRVKDYMDPAFSAAQMKEIRLGQQVGLDTSAYSNIHYTAAQMASVRHQLVFKHLKDIFKSWAQNFKVWVGEKIGNMTERIMASAQNREVRSPEELQKAHMDEAIQEVKTTLINSELLPEEAYEDKTLDANIKSKLEELAEDYGKNPDNLDKQAAKKVKEVCKEAGAELNMNQDKLIYAKSTEEAVEEVMNEQEQFERLEAMMYEQMEISM